MRCVRGVTAESSARATPTPDSSCRYGIYKYVRYYHWEKTGEGYMGLLLTTFAIAREPVVMSR